MSGLLISWATPAPSEPMAASERERSSRSWVSRSSLLFCSTRFSRVSFQAVISSVWRRISSAGGVQRGGHGVEGLGQLAQLVVRTAPRARSPACPGRSAGRRRTSAPTRADRLRASAAPISAATKPETPIQNTVDSPAGAPATAPRAPGARPPRRSRISGTAGVGAEHPAPADVGGEHLGPIGQRALQGAGQRAGGEAGRPGRAARGHHPAGAIEQEDVALVQRQRGHVLLDPVQRHQRRQHLRRPARRRGS